MKMGELIDNKLKRIEKIIPNKRYSPPDIFDQ